jgi:hypothetical protein
MSGPKIRLCVAKIYENGTVEAMGFDPSELKKEDSNNAI